MTVVLVVVIVVLLVLLGAGFIVVARRTPIDRAGRRSLPPGGEVVAGGDGAAAEAETEPSRRGEVAEVPPVAGPRPAEETGPLAGPAPERAGAPAVEAGAVAEAAGAAGTEGAEVAAPAPAAGVVEDGAVLEQVSAERDAPPSFRERLARTRNALASSLGGLRGQRRLDERTLEDLEEALLLADVGLPTTTRLLDDLRARLRSGEASESSDLAAELKATVASIFEGEDRSLRLDDGTTSVWLVVGVNGAGKTTTIGKLAAREVAAGRRVVLGAGDTFRAAAGDQLELWADRSGASIVRGAEGADPSSVIFDAVQHAAARGAGLVLADSAGRLHTKVNLMEELRKVRRIADRPPGHVTEVLLVLDATTGQNGLIQAREFTDAVGVTGVVLTKLDGTAKGGIAIAIRSELGLPIKLVGLGEGALDLVEFDPAEYADALFG